MRYELRLTAYDVMDQVQVTLSLFDTSRADLPGAGPVLHTVSLVRGMGEDSPSRWTIDALVAALETL